MKFDDSHPLYDIYLACRPDHFCVEYVINGHMINGYMAWLNNSDHIFATVHRFWKDTAATITDHGNKLITALHDPRCPDDVFDADSSISFRGEDGKFYALMSRMKCPERRAEVNHARRALRAAGFRTVESDCVREGSGDTLFDPNFGIWWTGIGKRTSPGAGRQLSALSGRPVIEVPTIDDHFYHLDTFLSFLPSGHVVLYKEAMTAETYNTICSLYPADKRLELTKSEAMAFGANLQIVTAYAKDNAQTHHVLIPHDCPSRVAETVKEWGYEVKPVNISGVRHAGGGVHCCFQRVWDLGRHPMRLPDDFNTPPHRSHYRQPHLYRKKLALVA